MRVLIVAEPLSIFVDTYGTGKKTNEELVDIIRKNWDLRPGVIGNDLNTIARLNPNIGIFSPTVGPHKATISEDCFLWPLR